MITETQLFDLAKTRPDMACIFQTPIYKYPRFTVYKTFIVCFGLNHITSYNTTELKDDIITLSSTDKDLNKKIEESGYDPEFNVIYSFFVENDTLK